MKQSLNDDAIAATLSAAHEAINARHDQARHRLLSNLTVAVTPLDQTKLSPTTRRYLIGGLGLSAVAAALIVVLGFIGPEPSAVAMERMAQALDHITSYTFRMEKVYISRLDEGRKVEEVLIGRWRAEPISLHGRTSMIETKGTNTATPAPPKKLVDVEETHQAGSRGILIDHLKQKYWWIDDEFDAASVPGNSPQVIIYKVRQHRGRVLRELGEKKIDGRLAQGLEILLDGADPVSDLGPATPKGLEGQAMGWDWRNLKVEIWIDPKTDLPIEFRCARSGDDFETTYRFTDLEWNVKFAADAFDAVAPEGYTEVELPVEY